MITDDTLYSARRRLFYLTFRTQVTVSLSHCVPSSAIAKTRVNPHRREEARLTAGSSAGCSGCLPSITRKKKKKERTGPFRMNADRPVILTLHELN